MDDFWWRDKYAEAVDNADRVHAEAVKAAAVEAGYSRYKTLYLIDAWLMPESEKGSWFLKKIGQDFARAEFRALLIATLDLRDVEYYLHTTGDDADIRRANAGRLARDAVKQVWPLSAAEQKAEKNERERYRRAFRSWQNSQKGKQEKMPMMPSSTHVKNYMEVVAACSGNAYDLQNRKPKVTHNTTLQVTEEGEKAVFEYSTVKSKTSGTSTLIELPDYQVMQQSSALMQKFCLYAFTQISKQALSGTEIKSHEIYFTPADLVQEGMYETEQSALNEFLRVSNLMSRDSIIKIKRKAGKRTIKAGTGPLFIWAGMENGKCKITISPEFDGYWKELATGFDVMPPFINALAGRAQTLLYNICCYARMNTDRVSNDGFFTISMKAVQMKLNLPDIEGNKNADRVVKQIEAAIQAIEDAQQKYGEKFLDIEVCGIGRGTPKDYMQGCLKIIVHGRMKDHLLQLEKGRQKQIKKKKQREEKALENAATQLVMERMKAAENPPDGTNNL